ncbi:MAG: hypothetical protein FWF05_08370, partial [Oscillospiraceae bacterium]|nr:hypothetical protein [Oscillospiraceae bacterium]
EADPTEPKDEAAAEPESRTYQAELSDPGCPDRMEVFGAEDDADALRQAYEYCEGEVLLLELFELDDDYNIIRPVEIAPRTGRLTIEMPLGNFTPEKLDNLANMVAAREFLLRKALGTDDLAIRVTDDTIKFPWFRSLEPEAVNAYSVFIERLCKTALEKKRVTAKERPVENMKFSMRVWLIGLGMVGPEFKSVRRVLLKNLPGNSAFKNGAPPKANENEATSDE